jgi:hypothetical protein
VPCFAHLAQRPSHRLSSAWVHSVPLHPPLRRHVCCRGKSHSRVSLPFQD